MQQNHSSEQLINYICPPVKHVSKDIGGYITTSPTTAIRTEVDIGRFLELDSVGELEGIAQR